MMCKETETSEDRVKVYLFGVDPEEMEYFGDNGECFQRLIRRTVGHVISMHITVTS